MKPFHNLIPISIISTPLLLCWRTSSYATEHRIASFLNSEFTQPVLLLAGICDETVEEGCTTSWLEQHGDSFGTLSQHGDSFGTLSPAFGVDGGSIDGGKKGRKKPNSSPDSWNGTLNKSSVVGEPAVRYVSGNATVVWQHVTDKTLAARKTAQLMGKDLSTYCCLRHRLHAIFYLVSGMRQTWLNAGL